MAQAQQAYEHFKLAIYCTAGCLDKSLEEIAKDVDFFQRNLKLSKVYLENHRGDKSLSRERLRELKAFFEARGIEVAGGITPTLGAAYRPGFERLFGGICYTDEASRAKFREAVENAAAVFDEVLFDDFFFTNCGCDDCLARKGDRSWEEFRLELMTEVSEHLILKPARAVNPKSRMIIKYPNWNEAYQASGYNTETQPRLFDGLYTGTETRDPAISQQHIPRYASYSLLRWMDNLAPGRNGGGWFDSLDCTYVDYYLEQAYLTVFGKAKELTLFCYSLLRDSYYIPALGFQLDKLDRLAGELGHPVGVTVYEPHHAKGEDHLYDYLGMLGIPMELTPHFPAHPAAPLLITQNVARDGDIIDKMKSFLQAGGQIVMTSGFVKRMTGHGVEAFTTMRPTGKRMAVQQFALNTNSCTFDEFALAGPPLSYPIFDYSTNGTWQSIVALNGHNNIPILMYDNYGKGKIHTLVIPDHYADLWKLPEPVVTALRGLFTARQLDYRVEGPANAGLFAYDNGAFVLENFAPQPQKWRILIPHGRELTGLTAAARATKLAESERDGASLYEVRLQPSTYAAFRVK
ncbi:permease [Cohnella nanjingensis]|uniref:Permease n=1 Tax=Cohnella nanjingensis TaxID=1387779 RepID=A0A7X0RLQ5_9BACL|nr:permease [Cohnella nanjingensis]MBB6669837.1 permease [Cohnella nanjingensis]